MKRLREEEGNDFTFKHDRGEQIVRLNVGGSDLATTRQTLINSKIAFPNSLLSFMFSKNEMLLRDERGYYFIDADIKIFRHIIEVIRRPSLVEYIPQEMSAMRWREELNYWGLSDLSTLDENAQYIKTLEELSLEELGRQINKEIMTNESNIIKTILLTTGYFTSLGKTREVSLYIPIGKHALPGGIDLGYYIETHIDQLTKQLKDMLGQCDVTIKKHNKTMNDHNYTFNEMNYCTKDTTTMIIMLKFARMSSY